MSHQLNGSMVCNNFPPLKTPQQVTEKPQIQVPASHAYESRIKTPTRFDQQIEKPVLPQNQGTRRQQSTDSAPKSSNLRGPSLNKFAPALKAVNAALVANGQLKQRSGSHSARDCNLQPKRYEESPLTLTSRFNSENRAQILCRTQVRNIQTPNHLCFYK